MDKAMFLRGVAASKLNYRPTVAVLAQLANVDVLAVVGPTGVGKSTLTHRAGLPFVLSDVTRAPRASEHDGVDYNFRTDLNQLLAEVQSGQFVQYVVEGNGEFYGTKASSYPASGSCCVSVLAKAIPNFKTYGFKSVKPIFIVPPNYSEWMRRINQHRDKDLESRLLEAKESLSWALADPSYVFILNENIEDAVKVLQDINLGKVDAGMSARGRNAANLLHEHLQKVIT